MLLILLLFFLNFNNINLQTLLNETINFNTTNPWDYQPLFIHGDGFKCSAWINEANIDDPIKCKYNEINLFYFVFIN